ncbi:MAG TPA: hypothetical protein VFZ91_06925 [Allosphingosinicella sp.]
MKPTIGAGLFGLARRPQDDFRDGRGHPARRCCEGGGALRGDDRRPAAAGAG